jgi:predicted ferric reductase
MSRGRRKGASLEHSDTPDAKNTELSTTFVGEARSARDSFRSPIPYRAPWFAGVAWGTLLCVAYPILILTPLAAFGILSTHSHRKMIAEVGLDFAVVGFTILTLQFVVSARLRWIEAPFGLDVLFLLHRTMAFVAVGLLCLHPLLLAWEEGWVLLTRWQAPWPIWAGRLALLLLIAHLAMAIFRRALQLSYETWRRSHNAAALLLLGLAFLHSLALGDDFESVAARAVWAVLLSVAWSAWFYSRFARPHLLRRTSYRVALVAREAPRVWTVTLEPPVGGWPLYHAPGQFLFLRPQSGAVPDEEHPFSIASSPSVDGLINMTIKESGDFTATVGGFKPGDLATVHGPFGRFSHVFHPKAADLVFVAGGVGITPLISMLRYMRDQRDARRVLLVYANRTATDILFQNELESIQSGGYPSLKTIHVLSQPPAEWDGPTGRLDTEFLRHLCDGLSEKTFFICCPPTMASGLIRGLKRAGVGPERIHADYFGL